MYLFQKFDYKVIKITSVVDFEKLEFTNKAYCGYDTETDGLHLIGSTPFLYVFGFDKTVCYFLASEELVRAFIEFANRFDRCFAHNAKFDYHMTWNLLKEKPTFKAPADSTTVFRLTSYCDMDTEINLASIGSTYVDKSAKFASKVIKQMITTINAERKKVVVDLYNKTFPDRVKKKLFSKDWEAFKKNKIAFIEKDKVTQFFIDNYVEANYYDVFLREPELMISYALDDVVIMMEYLKTAIQILVKVDKDLRIFNQECDLIEVVADMERVGFKVDIDYFLKSREVLLDYKNKTYQKLWEYSDGVPHTAQQNEKWAKILRDKYGVNKLYTKINKVGKEILSYDMNKESLKAITGAGAEIAELLIKLRNLDKWIATYIDGKLNDVYNGRLYTSVNNSGAVSGRVSSNMQQQPKEPLRADDGTELFDPRKCFIPDDDYIFLFADEAQMELRVQAYYTLLVGNGDVNLCRAYIPFNCINIFTDEVFDITNKEHINSWDTGEWQLPDDAYKIWKPIDLHSLTTLNAFPFLENENHKEFSHYRRLGKMCNFLKNYQGGKQAIMDQLDVDEEIADKLDKAYYTSFPEVRTYQKWVTSELYKKGYVENLYGRRYYMANQSNFYKASNYVIQGTCADMVKIFEINVSKLLKDKKSKLVMPIHDELMFLLHKDEHYLIPLIKDIMEDTKHIMPTIPMICDLEIGINSWGEKENYKDERN